MPSFFFRRRLAASPSSAAVTAEPQAVDPVPEGAINASLIDRRIHQDINALAEQLSLSYSASYHLDIVAAQRTNSEHRSEDQGFTPLQPNRRRNPPFMNSQVQNRVDAQKTEFGMKAKQVSDDEGNNLISEPKKRLFVAEKNVDTVAGSLLPEALFFDSPGGTFGRRAIHESNRYRKSIPRVRSSLSQSTQSQPRSRGTSRSRRSDTDTTPRTPGSISYSQYNSESSSSVQSDRHNPTSPSQNTFGVPTPPNPTAGSKPNNSYFDHRETPPPLPPLDHPAFRLAPKSHTRSIDQIGRNKEAYPGDAKRLQEKHPRHFHSLPSIRGLTTSAVNDTKAQYKRSESHSSVLRNDLSEVNQTGTIEPPRRGHTRSQSKSSINSSRRSSVEICAKNASLVGYGLKYEKSWEAQVSRELLRLSLPQGMVEGYASTRGNNRSHGESGEARGLGSPFSFQDTLTPKLTHSLSHYRSAATEEKPQYTKKFPLKDAGPGSMSEGDVAINAVGNVNTNKKSGKKRTSSSSPASASRREGKSSTRSTPERTRTPSPPPPKLNTISSVTSGQNSSLLVPPTLSFTAPTPEVSPISPTRRTHHKSTPTHPTSVLRTPSPPPIQKSYSSGSGKRKADEAEVEGGTPPKEQREHHTTFAPEPRTHRASATSGSSHAPSSYHRNKRARISLSSDSQPAPRTAGSTTSDSPNAKNTGSWSSRGSHTHALHTQHASLPSTKEGYASPPRRSASRRSLSQASIPISAFMSPHAPSISRSSTFHMRDPRKPARVQETPWTLSFPSAEDREGRWALRGWVERGGSPLHAWLFFFGFIVFPLWWAASLFIPIPRTRRLEAGNTEKGVVLDDPQVEHDAKSWRKRCRIMAVVSIFTYIPFIALVAVFVH